MEIRDALCVGATLYNVKLLRRCSAACDEVAITSILCVTALVDE